MVFLKTLICSFPLHSICVCLRIMWWSILLSFLWVLLVDCFLFFSQNLLFLCLFLIVLGLSLCFCTSQSIQEDLVSVFLLNYRSICWNGLQRVFVCLISSVFLFLLPRDSNSIALVYVLIYSFKLLDLGYSFSNFL